MARTESEWLEIVKQDVESWQAARSYHRNSLTIILAALASVALSALALIRDSGVTANDIPFVAPFFISMIWFSAAVLGLAMIYHRKSLLLIEEALRTEAEHGLVDASDLVTGATYAIGFVASVLTVLLVWDSNLDMILMILCSGVIAFSAVTCGTDLVLLFSPKQVVKIVLEYFGFPKRRRAKPKIQKPSAKSWTLTNIRASVTGFAMGFLVIMIAWRLSPMIDYLLLGTQGYMAMHLAKSAFTQYGRMVDTDTFIDAMMSLRRWIVAAMPSSDEINEKYRLLVGADDMKPQRLSQSTPELHSEGGSTDERN